MDSPLALRIARTPACGIVVRFYLVGLALYALPGTRPLFIALIPLSLLLALGFVLRFHRPWNARTILWFGFVAVSAFALEWAGVQTGAVFGEYRYGHGLAPLADGTPLIIGCNWLLLVYASHALVAPLPAAWARIAAGSLLMVGYDLAAEWAAPAMQMWSFGAYPPLRNFVAWFAAAIVYHAGFEWLRIPTENPPAGFLFVAQAVFLLLIGLCSLVIA